MVLAVLMAVALAIAQVLMGGTRLLYSIPTCLVMALAGILSAWPRTRVSQSARLICLCTTVLFCVYLLARNYFSPVNYLARHDFLIITGSLTVYLLVALFLDRSKYRLWIFYSLLGLAVGHAVIGAIQFKRGDQFMLLPWIHRTDVQWRASGFYISPNHFAGLMEVITILSLSVVVWSNVRTSVKILIGYFGACCLLGLALSGSRGGYLSFSFALVVFAGLSLAAYRAGRFGKFMPALLVIIGSLVALGVVGWILIAQSGVLQARVAATYDPENMRWYLWRAALEQFHLQPVWGTGSGTYLYYGRMFRPAVVQNDPINVHNDYLHLLAEYGLAGAATFSLFFLSHIIAAVRNVLLLAKEHASSWDKRANQLALQIGATSSIAAYIVHSIVDFNLHIPANAFLMAWIFGMVGNPVILVSRASSALRNGVIVSARVVVVVAAIALIAFGIPKLPGEWYAERARVAIRDYQLADARAFAEEALKYEKRNPDIYYYAGEALREMSVQGMGSGQLLAQQALAMFQGALAQFPQDVRCRLKLAQTYDSLREFTLAEGQLEQAAKLDPTNSYVVAFHGLHYQSEGLLEDAAAQYELALTLDGRNELAKAGLAEVRRMLAPIPLDIPSSPASDKLLEDAVKEASALTPESGAEPSPSP